MSESVPAHSAQLTGKTDLEVAKDAEADRCGVGDPSDARPAAETRVSVRAMEQPQRVELSGGGLARNVSFPSRGARFVLRSFPASLERLVRDLSGEKHQAPIGLPLARADGGQLAQ